MPYRQGMGGKLSGRLELHDFIEAFQLGHLRAQVVLGNPAQESAPVKETKPALRPEFQGKADAGSRSFGAEVIAPRALAQT